MPSARRWFTGVRSSSDSVYVDDASGWTNWGQKSAGAVRCEQTPTIRGLLARVDRGCRFNFESWGAHLKGLSGHMLRCGCGLWRIEESGCDVTMKSSVCSSGKHKDTGICE